MKHKYIHSIRIKITILVCIFSFLLLTTFSLFLFNIYYNEQKTKVLQNTEFDLQFLTEIIDRDLENLIAMSEWSINNVSLNTYFNDPNPSAFSSVNAYESFNHEYISNSSKNYINRFLLYSGKDSILQVGSSTFFTNSIGLNSIISISKELSQLAEFSIKIENDVFSRANEKALIITRPFDLIFDSRGLSYLNVDLSVFTDKFSSFAGSDGRQIYLIIDDNFYLEDSASLIQTDFTATYKSGNNSLPSPLNTNSIYNYIIGENDEEFFTVSYPIKNIQNAYIMLLIPQSDIYALDSSYVTLFVVIFIVVLLGSLFFVIYMQKTFAVPVEKLCAQIKNLADGKFVRNEDIEWENELGDIGKGINNLSEEVVLLMDSRLKDEKEKQRLEYNMLQKQISPHFIYNTLNSIKWMATIQGATGIAEMTTAFSRLLKNVAKNNAELVPLREEFALLNDYNTIQQYRYGGSINLDIAKIEDENYCNCLIPRFTLQPIAENSIFHGIEPNGGIGNVLLHIEKNDEGDITISITDDGIGISDEEIKRIFSNESDNNSQIGILNVHKRLQFAFGKKYGIEMFGEKGKFTKTIIKIPCNKEN